MKNKPKVTFKKIANKPHIGIVNGLYATNSGVGGITIIEVMLTPSDKKLSIEKKRSSPFGGGLFSVISYLSTPCPPENLGAIRHRSNIAASIIKTLHFENFCLFDTIRDSPDLLAPGPSVMRYLR